MTNETTTQSSVESIDAQCTDKLCNNEAEFAYRFGDGFSRVHSPERGDLEDGDLCPFVCEDCRDRMAASPHHEAERFVRPEETLIAVEEASGA